jgi:hypothetical protein
MRPTLFTPILCFGCSLNRCVMGICFAQTLYDINLRSS